MNKYIMTVISGTHELPGISDMEDMDEGDTQIYLCDSDNTCYTYSKVDDEIIPAHIPSSFSVDDLLENIQIAKGN